MNIIVTGASRGLGREMVKILSNFKQHKVLAIARNKEALELLESEAEFGNIKAIPFDLEELASKRDHLIGQLKEESHHVDILINNAGFLGKCYFDEVGCELAEKIFRVNFFAPALFIRSMLPLMGGSEKSHVVNIGSMGGFQGSAKFPGLAYYSASKAAIACFTECLATELVDTNISFNCLALGAAQTEMLEEAFPDYQAPLKAKEMAEHIADFALNGHRYFNGKVIPVSLSTP